MSLPHCLLGTELGKKGLVPFLVSPLTRGLLARSSPHPRSLPKAQRERCDSRGRLVPGHKQPLTSPPPPRARPRWGRPSEGQGTSSDDRGPRALLRRATAGLPPSPNPAFDHFTHAFLTRPPGKRFATATSEREMRPASTSLPPTPITSNSQGEAAGPDAQTHSRGRPASADAAPTPTPRSFRGPSPPLPGARLRVSRPACSPLALALARTRRPASARAP